MLRSRKPLALACLSFGLWTGPGFAQAQETKPATQEQLQSIITQQMDAFGRDDAATARSFAAPGISRKYPDAKDFLAMVRHAYAPLFHPRSTHFAAPEQSMPGAPTETVTIIDSEGQAWTAVYGFEQVKGQWRINGCILVRDESTAI